MYCWPILKTLLIYLQRIKLCLITVNSYITNIPSATAFNFRYIFIRYNKIFCIIIRYKQVFGSMRKYDSIGWHCPHWSSYTWMMPFLLVGSCLNVLFPRSWLFFFFHSILWTTYHFIIVSSLSFFLASSIHPSTHPSSSFFVVHKLQHSLLIRNIVDKYYRIIPFFFLVVKKGWLTQVLIIILTPPFLSRK